MSANTIKKPAPPPSQEEVPVIRYPFILLQQLFSPYRSRTDMKAQKSLLNDKRPNIGITCRHRHSAEHAIALTPRDDPYIITSILLELRAPVLGDRSTGGVCFRRSGLVPVPGSVTGSSTRFRSDSLRGKHCSHCNRR